MFLKYSYFIFISLAFFVFATQSLAGTPIFPKTNKLPTYEVSIIPSPNLPEPKLQLTDRALRILPSYFIYAHKVPAYSVKIAPSRSRIILSQVEKTPYCTDDLKLCWPKSIEAVKGYLIITPHKGDIVYYRDSQNLEKLLWNEALEPLKALVKKSK